MASTPPSAPGEAVTAPAPASEHAKGDVAAGDAGEAYKSDNSLSSLSSDEDEALGSVDDADWELSRGGASGSVRCVS